MRFYVDFENVGTGGLIGIESLTENDSVRIYYSNNPNMDMYTVENMIHSPVKIQFIRLPDSLKKMNLANALDIVLLTDISRIVATLGSGNYAIVISNDKGYDSVITELNQTNNNNKIIRTDCIKSVSIQETTKNNTTSKTVDINAVGQLFNQALSKYTPYKDKVINIVRNSKTKCEINNKINQTFGSNQSKIIINELKPIIKNLPGQ